MVTEQIKNGDIIPFKLHKVFWIFDDNQLTNEVAHTMYHNRYYAIRFWENTDTAKKPLIKTIKTVNLKAFGFGRGIGAGFFAAQFIKTISVSKGDHSLSVSFKKSDKDDFRKTTAQIYNVFSYKFGIGIGFVLSILVLFLVPVLLKCLNPFGALKVFDSIEEPISFLTTIIVPGIVVNIFCIYVVYSL
jgi:uncharacterized protein YqhQ